MRKVNTKKSLGAKIKEVTETVVAKIKKASLRAAMPLCNNYGMNQHTDNAGYVVLGIALVAVIAVAAIAYVKGTYIPNTQNKLNGILGYNG